MTREELLQAAKLKSEAVELGHGQVVIVTELSAEEYLQALDHPDVKNDDGDYNGAAFNSLLVVLCVRDGDGNRLFTDDDASLIRNGSFAVYRKLVAAVNRINGLESETKN